MFHLAAAKSANSTLGKYKVKMTSNGPLQNPCTLKMHIDLKIQKVSNDGQITYEKVWKYPIMPQKTR
jgi:hypothetical protein